MTPRRYSLVRRDGRIWIDGDLGAMATSAAAVRRSLAEVGGTRPVRVVLDTSGGDCAEGLAIYVALRECNKPVHVTVRRAASMGCVVAMAGETIAIEPRGSFYLHPPGVRDGASPVVHLTAAMLRSAARTVDRTDAMHLDIMERRTGQSRRVLRDLQEARTTLDAAQAVALGFADRVLLVGRT